MTEGEMAGWHHRLSGHGFEQTQETAEDRGLWRAAVHGVAESRTRQRLNGNNSMRQIRSSLFP